MTALCYLCGYPFNGSLPRRWENFCLPCRRDHDASISMLVHWCQGGDTRVASDFIGHPIRIPER